jgi:hypothetical protein
VQQAETLYEESGAVPNLLAARSCSCPEVGSPSATAAAGIAAELFCVPYPERQKYS